MKILCIFEKGLIIWVKWSGEELGSQPVSSSKYKFFHPPFLASSSPPSCLPLTHCLLIAEMTLKSTWVKRKVKNEEPCSSPDQRLCRLVHLQCTNESSASYCSVLKLPMLEVRAKSRGADGRPDGGCSSQGVEGQLWALLPVAGTGPEGTAWRCGRGAVGVRWWFCIRRRCTWNRLLVAVSWPKPAGVQGVFGQHR